MSYVFNDNELGDAIHFISIAGLVILFLGCILFFVFYFQYHESIDNETTTQTVVVSQAAQNLEYSWITLCSIGYIMCFAILYGHYMKKQNDPKTVVGFNHVFHEFGDGLIKVETKLEDNDYKGSSSASRITMNGNFL